jgi:hypothetical protein
MTLAVPLLEVVVGCGSSWDVLVDDHLRPGQAISDSVSGSSSEDQCSNPLSYGRLRSELYPMEIIMSIVANIC